MNTEDKKLEERRLELETKKERRETRHGRYNLILFLIGGVVIAGLSLWFTVQHHNAEMDAKERERIAQLEADDRDRTEKLKASDLEFLRQHATDFLEPDAEKRIAKLSLLRGLLASRNDVLESELAKAEADRVIQVAAREAEAARVRAEADAVAAKKQKEKAAAEKILAAARIKEAETAAKQKKAISDASSRIHRLLR
jgi:hypothetical protein